MQLHVQQLTYSLTDICGDNDCTSGWRGRIIELIDNIHTDPRTFSHCILRLTKLDSCNYDSEREREFLKLKLHAIGSR